MNSKEFPALEQFLGGYLHQDFLLDYGTAEDAVAAFANEEPSDSIQAARRELDEILVRLEEGREEPSALLQRLGCYYNPAADGLSVRSWLDRVRTSLRRAAGEPDDHRIGTGRPG